MCGAATISFSAILVRAANVSPSTAAIFRCAYALPALIPLALLERSRAPENSQRRPWLPAAAGIFLAIDLISWHHSIADVGAGLATVLGNAQVAVVPFAAWFVYREHPPRRVLLMLPTAMLGVILVSGIVGGHAYGRHPVAGAAFGAVTAITYSIFLLLLRAGSAGPSNTVEPLLIATATGTIATSVIGAGIGDAHFVPTWPAHGWLALLALSSQVLGWILITHSLPRLPAAMTSIVLTVQPVGSLAFAALIFGEDPGVVQLLGALLILVTLTTMSIRSSDPPPAEG